MESLGNTQGLLDLSPLNITKNRWITIIFSLERRFVKNLHQEGNFHHKAYHMDTMTSFSKKKSLMNCRSKVTNLNSSLLMEPPPSSSKMWKSLGFVHWCCRWRTKTFYLCTLSETNIAPWKMTGPQKESRLGQKIWGAILSRDSSQMSAQMFSPYSIYGLKSLLKSTTSEKKTMKNRSAFCQKK